MKRTILVTAALVGLLATGCTDTVPTPTTTAADLTTATSSYTAAFKVVSEPQTALPGDESFLYNED